MSPEILKKNIFLWYDLEFKTSQQSSPQHSYLKGSRDPWAHLPSQGFPALLKIVSLNTKERSNLICLITS